MRLRNAFSSLVDWLFGYDFFVSYAHSDGKSYPDALAESLQRFGYKVFLDSKEYVPGDDLNAATKRRVRMSKYLILVARPAAQQSTWVAREVQVALEAGRGIIVIDVNGAFAATYYPPSALPGLIRHHIRIPENSDTAPADETLKQLQRSFKRVRQESLRLRVVSGMSVTFAAVAVAALVLFFRSESQRREIAASLSTNEFRDAARLLSTDGVAECVAHLSLAINADPNNKSAADRLYTVLTQRHPGSQVIRRITFDQPVTRDALREDGRKVATAHENGDVVLTDWQNGPRIIRNGKGTGGTSKPPIGALTFDKSGGILAAVDDKGTAMFWETAGDASSAGEKKVCAPTTTVPIERSAIAFSADSTLLAVACGDGNAVVVSRQDEKVHATQSRNSDLIKMYGALNGIRFSAMPNAVLLFQEFGVARWRYDDNTYEMMSDPDDVPDPDDGQRRNMLHEISPDEQWVAYVTHDYGNFQAVELPRDQLVVRPIGEWSKHSEAKNHWQTPSPADQVFVTGSPRFSSDSQHLLATFSPGGTLVFKFDGSVVSKDPATLAPTVQFYEQLPHVVHASRGSAMISADVTQRDTTLSARAKSFSLKPSVSCEKPAARRILRDAGNGDWIVEDVNTPYTAIAQLHYPWSDDSDQRHQATNDQFGIVAPPWPSAAISANGKVVVTLAAERAPAAWRVDVATSAPILLGKDGGDEAGWAVLNEDGTKVLVGYVGEGSIADYRVFDTTGKTTPVAGRFDGAYLGISPDFAAVVTANGSRVTLRGLDGRQLGQPMDLGAEACSAAFSADGRMIAATAETGAVVVFDWATGIPLSEKLSVGREPVQEQREADPGQAACPTLWFSGDDTRLNVRGPQDETLTWTVRVATNPREAQELAELSMRYLGVSIAANGDVVQGARPDMAEMHGLVAQKNEPKFLALFDGLFSGLSVAELEKAAAGAR